MERPKELKEILREVSGSFFSSQAHGELQIQTEIKPLVISIVGVNGAGKTTTIGKLAHQLQKSGRTVLLGAVDTFRAGAISQLKVWADRTGAQFVTGREGADPGAVAFDSVTAAKARGLDVVLLDTAGRLHTKSNLMEELKKIHKVVKKVIPEAPHETWLVIDGTLGQNSVIQATASRNRAGLAETSTMRASPRSSRWLRRAPVMVVGVAWVMRGSDSGIAASAVLGLEEFLEQTIDLQQSIAGQFQMGARFHQEPPSCECRQGDSESSPGIFSEFLCEGIGADAAQF